MAVMAGTFVLAHGGREQEIILRPDGRAGPLGHWTWDRGAIHFFSVAGSPARFTASPDAVFRGKIGGTVATLVKIGAAEPGETPMVTVPAPPPRLDIPLAGDVVEAIAKRIGADRLAKLWEKWTGQPCGCEERREKLNRATERLARWWEGRRPKAS